MYPIYKFELTVNGTTQRAFPIYGGDLAKEFEKESGQQFFRAKLSGDLTFENADYSFITSQAFDAEFLLEMFISYDAGQTWTSYWRGNFWKTDCVFDIDAGTVVVQPTVLDQYTDVLAGLDKEYNLIDLAPEIIPIKADKRPMTQIYVLGETTIGCFLSGMYWEQECEAVTDETVLHDTYYFGLNATYREVNVSGSLNPNATGIYIGEAVAGNVNYLYPGSPYSFRYTYQAQSQYVVTTWEIIRNSDNVAMWRYQYSGQNPPFDGPLTLTPVSGSGATGTATVNFREIKVYARLVSDLASFAGVPNYPIPANDIAVENRNYHYVVFSYNVGAFLYLTNTFSATPTQWGLYQPGKYYQTPDANHEYFPVGRKDWTGFALWFRQADFDVAVESQWRSPFIVRDAYPLFAVISVLLEQFAPNISHDGTTAYSQFLYGQNLIGVNQTLAITPKSNIVSSGYDQPAQKAPITLRNVLDMLRDCFRCFWFIDEQNRFRIEHIQFFRKGGSYTGSPVVGIDLTAETVTRNGKAWAFARDQYRYDKPAMAARYQFGWMDDVTQLFEGYPMDIVSKFVNPENIEQITVSKFTSDIDYILLNPSAVSMDGFVLLAAVLESGEYILPYYDFSTSIAQHYLQNGYVAFAFLQQYYAYDMPAWEYVIDGVQKTAYGVKRLKNQTLTFPALFDPDLVELIKTNLGNGEVSKLSLNLTSRGANATLNFDIEGGGVPSTEYRVVFGDASHIFAANGGSYTLVVYGVKYENGVEVERTQLSASALTFTKSGDAPITRSGLTFSASSLGANETPAKTANWLVKWNAQNVSATFITTQSANVKTVTGQTTSYTPTQQEIIWDNSGTTVANGQQDYATFIPSVRIIVTQNYVYSSGVSGLEIVSNTLNRIDPILNIVSGDGLYRFEQGSGDERYYRIQWAQNSTGNVRQGTLRLIYDEQYWDYTITQAAVEHNITYALEIDPVNYTFPVDGETISLSVEGVTRTDGVVTSREYLTASELTFTATGDNVATRNGLQFTAADISAIYQDYTSQNWHIVWNAHPIATANLGLSQMANIFGYPEWIETSLGVGTKFYITDVDELRGWIEYTGPEIVYIAIDEDNIYVNDDVFDDSGMTQADVIGTVTAIGNLQPFTPVPQGYTPLSYAEVPLGSQAYINTGVLTGNTIGFEICAITYDPIGTETYGCLFGGRYNSNRSDFQLTTYASGSNQGTLRLGGSSQNYNGHIPLNTEFTAKLQNNVYSIGGNDYTVAHSISTARNIYLFALNNNNTAAQHGHSAVKRFILYDGSQPILFYKPYKDANNVVGFWDAINKEFKTPTSGVLIGIV